MEEALDTIRQINWFLDPIKDGVMFFLATPGGRRWLLLLLLLYVALASWRGIAREALAHKAAERNLYARPPLLSQLLIVGAVMFRTLAGLVTQLPMILSVVLVLMLFTGLSAGLTTVDEYFSNRERIRELSQALRHLDQEFKVAEIEVVDFKENTTFLEFRIYDYAGTGAAADTLAIDLVGNEIFIDAVVLNFDYALIETGQKINLTLPYRVYSNLVPPQDGKPLQLSGSDTLGIPLMFNREQSQIYGMDRATFQEHVAHVATLARDPEAARAEGVRSIQGNAVRQVMFKGQRWSLWSLQTGGIALRREQTVWSAEPIPGL